MRLPRDVRMPSAGQFRFGTANPAAAGSSQATATQLAAQVNIVTAADGTKAVALPDTDAALAVYILNTVTTAVLPVYPKASSSDTINGGSANAAFNLGAGRGAWFVAISATGWYVADDASTAESLSGLTATVAEVNRAADLSARVVALAVSTSITEAAHEGRTIVMGGAGSARTFTLPAATGAGGRYRFVVGAVNTSSYLIKSVVGSDLMEGLIIGASTGDSATDAARTWLSGATDDTVTLNGTTTGGAAVGDWVEFEDLSAIGWFVRGMVTQSGTEATPFSDTVT